MDSKTKNDGAIRIVDFEPEHFRSIVLRAEDSADIAGLTEEELLHSWRGGRTLLYGEAVVLFYGAGMDRGTGYIWAVTSPLAEKLPLLVTRLGREMVRSLLRCGCHRVEAFCHVGNMRSLNWLTRCLGFQAEGLLRRSGPNAQDRYVLSVIRYQ